MIVIDLSQGWNLVFIDGQRTRQTMFSQTIGHMLIYKRSLSIYNPLTALNTARKGDDITLVATGKGFGFGLPPP